LRTLDAYDDVSPAPVAEQEAAADLTADEKALPKSAPQPLCCKVELIYGYLSSKGHDGKLRFRKGLCGYFAMQTAGGETIR